MSDPALPPRPGTTGPSVVTLTMRMPDGSLQSADQRISDNGGWSLFLPWAGILAAMTLLFLMSGGQSGRITMPPLASLTLLALILGPIFYLLVQLVRTSTPGPNRFGPNPYEVPQ